MFLLASLLRSSDIATAALTANERRLLRSAYADVTAMADTPQALAIAARLHRLVEPLNRPPAATGRPTQPRTRDSRRIRTSSGSLLSSLLARRERHDLRRLVRLDGWWFAAVALDLDEAGVR